MGIGCSAEADEKIVISPLWRHFVGFNVFWVQRFFWSLGNPTPLTPVDMHTDSWRSVRWVMLMTQRPFPRHFCLTLLGSKDHLWWSLDGLAHLTPSDSQRALKTLEENLKRTEKKKQTLQKHPFKILG